MYRGIVERVIIVQPPQANQTFAVAAKDGRIEEKLTPSRDMKLRRLRRVILANEALPPR